MAGSATATLSATRADTLNKLFQLNLFKRGLDELLAAVERELAKPHRDPFTEVDPNRSPHEHDTRLLFVDELLTHLGWKLGARGNVLEEARLQADTTTFMDYVGVIDITCQPLLLVEAKAWNNPPISARRKSQKNSPAELIVAAIQHIRTGTADEASPVIAEWDDYLRQVHGYVQTLKQQYGHDLLRVVIISGEWMVVFVNPRETFLGASVPADITIFPRSSFKENAEEIFKLLHRSTLTEDAPIPLRPSQLRRFVDLNSVAGVFHGLHVHYEGTGSKLFTRRPRILIYPALFVVRNDGAVYTVIYNENPVDLFYQQNDQGGDTLSPHLDAIQARNASLLSACEAELGGALPVAGISAFPGFRSDGMEKMLVSGLVEADEWLVVTGNAAHFLLSEPRVEGCRFHSWENCGDDAALESAISVPTLDPPAFFVNAQPHHCANRIVQDRREGRCLIQAIDSRTCCQACVYLDHCWDENERAGLPCGK